jgi:outer membrane lipoprotein SlyB
VFTHGFTRRDIRSPAGVRTSLLFISKIMKKFASFFGVDTPVMVACLLAAIAMIILSLATPAAAQSGSIYRQQGAQVVQNVSYGFVLQTREVLVEASAKKSNTGAVVGATFGGVLLSQVARNSGNRDVGAFGLIGAALGGLAGNSMATESGGQRAVEVLVQVQNGRQPKVIAIVQPYPGPDVFMGQQVLVLSDRGQTRIIPVVQVRPQPQQPQQLEEDNEVPAPGYYQQQDLRGKGTRNAPPEMVVFNGG